jgi:hypothetical protein
MYIYMYTCMHMFTDDAFDEVYLCVYSSIDFFIYVYIYAYLYVCEYIYACMCIRMYISWSVYIHIPNPTLNLHPDRC